MIMSRKIYVKKGKLEKIRINKALNQKEFAEDVLDVNYSWYNQIENGAQALSPKRAGQVCEKLGKDFDQIFALREDQKTIIELLEEEGLLKEDREKWERLAEGVKDSEIVKFLKEYLKVRMRARELSPTYPESVSVKPVSIYAHWEAVVAKALNMLEEASSFWWGEGVLASWIHRGDWIKEEKENLGEKYAKGLKDALKRGVNVRILINSAPEVLIPARTSHHLGELAAKEVEDTKDKIIKDKVKRLIDTYKDEVKDKKMVNRIKWFPHGDIRVFISDKKKEDGSIKEEVMLAIATPTLAGGEESRYYKGIVLEDPSITIEYKKRFNTLWEYAAQPAFEQGEKKT